MRRRTKIVLAVAGVVVLSLAGQSVDEGIYLGSRSEPMTWVEENGQEVRGTVLMCRYYKLRVGSFEEPYWTGPHRVIMVPDGEGTFLQVNPSHVGVERCPLRGFWTFYAREWASREKAK